MKLFFRKMQIKTTMRYHLTLVQMTTINTSTNKKCCWGCGEKGNFCTVVGMQTGAATVESSMEITQKVKNGSAFWPSDPTSENITEGTQNINLEEHKYPYVHCSIIYNHQDMEAAQVSINRWVDKTAMGHLHNGILLSCKKEKFTLCYSVDEPGEHYAKWNKPVRERQMPYNFTHMWTLLNKLN